MLTNKKSRVALCIALTSFLFSGFPVHASTAMPARANIFLVWDMSAAQARELAKWDLVILDAEIGAKHPEYLQTMRTLHPGIIILAYISAQEVHRDITTRNPNTPLRAELANRLTPDLYARRATGADVSFWSSARVMNITGPWQTILPQLIHEKILSTGLWNGVMLDNVWDSITWYVGTDIDLDADGVSDDTNTANTAWKKSMQTIINSINTQNPGMLVIGNGNSLDNLSGRVFESFPTHGWQTTLDAARAQGGITIINSGAQNKNESRAFTAMRFGLTSTLLTDSFYSFDFGDQAHESLWWYDEYNYSLGRPLGPAVQNGATWQREFQNGTVFVNPYADVAQLQLGSPFETLHGAQNPRVNTGKSITKLSLAPRDGIILLRPLTHSTQAPIGARVRVWNDDGTERRIAFTQTEKPENTRVTLSKKTFLFLEKIRGAVQIIDRGETILVGAYANRTLTVKEYSRAGTLLSTRKIPAKNSKTILAAEDTDYNGSAEILTFDPNETKLTR